MDINVLHFRLYQTRYYLTHPWKWFQHLFQSIKDAYHRAVWGFCPTDVWNIDEYLLAVLPHMFRYLAKNGCAYPGTNQFPSPEAWHEHLEELANTLDSLQDEKWYKEADKLLENRDTITQWKECVDKLNKERQILLKQTFATIGNNLHLYWD